MLERQAFEERFATDVLLGDLTWNTSYSLPGEGLPPRAQADLTLVWPSWSQTAWRTWYAGETSDQPPAIEIEVVIRLQRLAESPDPTVLLAILPAAGPLLGNQQLERSAPTVETQYSLEDSSGAEPRARAAEFAMEVSWEGSYELGEDTLSDGSVLDSHFAAMGGWISSTLVAVGDLDLAFLPPVDELPFEDGNP